MIDEKGFDGFTLLVSVRAYLLDMYPRTRYFRIKMVVSYIYVV